MPIWALFTLIFVGGPVMFHIGLWYGRTRRGEALILAITLALVLAGLLLQQARGQASPTFLAGGAVAFWLAWVGILVFCVLRIRRVLPGLKIQRWSRVLGAIGTTIPWFGFVSATMLAG